MTMRLVINNHDEDHFTVFTDEPMRIEVSLISVRDENRIIAHAYRGDRIDMEQEPTLTYDGSEADEMEDMVR